MPHRAPRTRSAVSAVLAGTAALAAAALALVSPAILVPAQASAQSAVHYVPLGDSYASGVGAGSYIGSSGSYYPAFSAAAG